MRNNLGKIFFSLFLLILLGAVFSVTNFVLAQASQEVQNRRAQLEVELLQIENEIAGQRTILQSKQKERVSLERDVAILDAKIDKSRLEIRATDINISKLSSDIGGKQNTIYSLDEKVEREKASLAQIIRRTNEIDSFSLVEC